MHSIIGSTSTIEVSHIYEHCIDASTNRTLLFCS